MSFLDWLMLATFVFLAVGCILGTAVLFVKLARR